MWVLREGEGRLLPKMSSQKECEGPHRFLCAGWCALPSDAAFVAVMSGGNYMFMMITSGELDSPKIDTPIRG